MNNTTDDDGIMNEIILDNDPYPYHPILSLSLVNEIFEYIHNDFNNIIYRHGNRYRRLPISIIFNSGLEDYFAIVLLSDRLKRKLCSICARLGQLESLKWARSNGCPWGIIYMNSGHYKGSVFNGTCAKAITAGHLHILKWARENGCPLEVFTCSTAARNGHLHILQWARANDYPWDSNTCSNAAGRGYLNILQWARENNCPWNSETCTSAAKGGHLNTLKWLRENGCNWDTGTMSTAIRNKQFDIVAWALNNGAPVSSNCSERLVGIAFDANRFDIIQLSIDRGCKCSDYIRQQLLLYHQQL